MSLPENGHTNGLSHDVLEVNGSNGHVSANGHAQVRSRPGISTLSIHAGQDAPATPHKPVIPPLYLSSTYELDYPGQEGVYDYSRSGNPTREVLEETLAQLEGAKYAITYSSGLGANTSISYLLKTGDHVLVGDDSYGGTNRFFTHCASRMGIATTFVDFTDLSTVSAALRPETKMVWLESPTNPTMKIIDIRAVSRLSKAHRADILVVIDNTFMSSFFQKPLELGADISYQSLTKYINGHSDVVMGGVTTNAPEVAGRLKYLQNALGAVPSPFDCFLVKRGVKTLSLRMNVHQSNGLAIAKYLEGHPMVRKVLHPGLKSHPQRKLALEQCSGFSGMVTFFIEGDKVTSAQFVKALKYFKLAVSLGGVQSLVEIPFVMSHASVDRDHCRALGIDDSLIRLSVGIEDAQDLINDLDQAFGRLIKAAD